MSNLYIATDNEYLYYSLSELDTTKIDVDKQRIIDITEEELWHILALKPFWKSHYLEKLLDDGKGYSI